MPPAKKQPTAEQVISDAKLLTPDCKPVTVEWCVHQAALHQATKRAEVLRKALLELQDTLGRNEKVQRATLSMIVSRALMAESRVLG